MNFLIVGVGALGSAYLAFLTRAGHRAVGLLKKGRRLEEIRVEGIWGEFSQRVQAVDDPSKVDFEPDLILLTVKSYDTDRALEDIRSLVAGKTLLMVAQNGYGNYEKAVARYGENRVVLARVIFGAKLLEWGSVRITVCADDVVIGNPAQKIDQAFMQELAHIFTQAGIPTRHEKEVYKYLWDKILYNCALNPLGALLEKTYGELAQNPHTKNLMDAIIEEAFLVSELYSIPSFWSRADEYKRHFYERLVPPTSAHYPSMLEDLRKGKTEIDALNGALVALAKRKGIDLSVNRAITELIKAVELFNLSLKR